MHSPTSSPPGSTRDTRPAAYAAGTPTAGLPPLLEGNP